MDLLTEEIERIVRQEHDVNQCYGDEGEMKSALYKGITCLLNIMLLAIAISWPVLTAIMIGRLLKKAGNLLLKIKK